MLKDALRYGHGCELSIMNALPGTKSTCNNIEQLQTNLTIFTALQWKAWSCDCMSSISLSVRLSVTLVDQDHTGWKSWKLTAQTISPTPSLFAAQKSSTSNPRGTWGNFGETKVGVGKSGTLEHKSSNICETLKDREKVTMEGLQELTNALQNGTILDPLRPPLPQDWRFATSTQNCHRYYLINGQSYTDCKIWAIHSQGPSKQKPYKLPQSQLVRTALQSPIYGTTKHFCHFRCLRSLRRPYTEF